MTIEKDDCIMAIEALFVTLLFISYISSSCKRKEDQSTAVLAMFFSLLAGLETTCASVVHSGPIVYDLPSL
jgi:hypothetical protein